MTEIKGLDSGGKEREDAAEDLHTVMANVDPNTEILHITGDSPTDDQWEALGRYFTNVRYLKVFTGWDEEWIDAKFPLNWPLELLLIGDAGGERVTTPVILEGRVKHLVLCYTYNLRFEGPTTKELMKNAEQIGFISRSEPQEAQPDGIKIYSAPHEWKKWFISKYAGKEISLDPENPGGPVSAMRKLEILGNDAIDMFTYIALTKFHLLAGLESLTVYSLSENDLFYTLGAFFLGLPRHLDRLRHFRLILGSPMVSRLVQENEGHPFLAALLPPNLETLQFRGPVSMASHLEGLAAAFADKVFLPSLKRVSLVLDLPDKTEGSKNRSKPSLDELRVAKEACTKVLDAAARRGVVVEQFREPWVEEHPVLFHDVDKRWAEIEPTCY
ncbi:hypothetical protein C8A03DRAFT_19892 [Achaetomium macrosporum]|uniref:Uncharacterized protein n=1 Tax=Achaetomium macrosporum TaxID=79813 RepID=A0AAN7C1Q1_9PEZI|nr:hypothetical protein C8A03DRAFT_19892 [Achaetomium macrosporum]